MPTIRDALRAGPTSSTLVVELDYSQLEIYCLAMLCKDNQLIQDLINGVDMHQATAAQVLQVPIETVTKEQRGAAKAVNFQLTYGAGAKRISDETGEPQHVCQSYIDGFYARYPGVKDWHTWLLDSAVLQGVPTGHKTPTGVPIKQWQYILPYGKRYTFMQEIGHYGVNISPTKLKNHPVQGTASDIIRMALAEMVRQRVELFQIGSIQDAYIRPMNTVHDSVLLKWALPIDVEVSYVDLPRMEGASTIKRIRDIMVNYPEQRMRAGGFDWPAGLHLKVDVEVGKTWQTMKKLDI